MIFKRKIAPKLGAALSSATRREDFLAGRYGLQIRGAVGADATGLADLLLAAGRPIAVKPLSARLEGLEKHPGVVLLAVEWGPPSGVIQVHWRRTLLAESPIAAIDLLVVRPEDRRRGIGRLLLKAGSQAARAAGCDVLCLAADPQETALIAFGLAAGFIETGRRYERSLRKRT